MTLVNSSKSNPSCVSARTEPKKPAFLLLLLPSLIFSHSEEETVCETFICTVLT